MFSDGPAGHFSFVRSRIFFCTRRTPLQRVSVRRRIPVSCIICAKVRDNLFFDNSKCLNAPFPDLAYLCALYEMNDSKYQ